MQETLNILTLVGAIQGLFFGLVLFRLPGGNRMAHRFLALFLASFSVCMLGIIGYTGRWVLQVPHLGLVHVPFAAILGAPFLLHIVALTQKDFNLRLKHWALFFPFLVVAIWLIPFFGMSAGAKRIMLEQSYQVFPDEWRYIFIFSNLLNFGYIAASYILVLRHERVIQQVYSNPLNKTLSWTRHFLYAGTAIFLACVTMSFFDIVWADSFSNFFFSILIYVFGYRALRQPDIFSDLGKDTLPEPADISLVHPLVKYEKSGLTKEKALKLLERLEQLVADEKVFLDPTLNLQQLAVRLDIPPHQLSQLLNQFKRESFSDFVNGYRVEHFKKAVADPANAHLSLLGIAFESGFNSKAAFNDVFKKKTGVTPSDFVKNSPSI